MSMTKSELDAWLEPRTTEDGDCLIWSRAVNSSGHPVASLGGKHARSVRRFVARNAGKQVTVKTVVVNTCNRLRFVNPDHLSAVSHSAKTKLAWNRGLVNETVFRANHARSAQARSKLSWNEVRAIRARNANGESMASLAREYGVWVSAISSICNHQRWVDAGPYAQLVR